MCLTVDLIDNNMEFPLIGYLMVLSMLVGMQIEKGI